MITWTQGGTTKSINNNNIVYAKQGADGEPVLIDRIIAVDTSTNPPTESVVYQSNSILRALSSPQTEQPSLTGGQSWYGTSDTSGHWVYKDYYWITYATLHNRTSIGNTYGTLNTTGYEYQYAANRYSMSVQLTNVPAAANRYHIQVPLNIQYTYATPYRVVVKATAAASAIGLRITDDTGYNSYGWGGRCNSYTVEQVLYDGLMDNVTKNYSFNVDTVLGPFSALYASSSQYGSGTNKDFTFNDWRKWTNMRMRGNMLSVPNAITRTVEIYDPNTGNLIASNTSALSTTWTARH